jgi:hypothetical protein
LITARLNADGLLWLFFHDPVTGIGYDGAPYTK